MNKAVIICVLSLAMCLTQAAPPTDEHPALAPGASTVKPADDKKVPAAVINSTTTSLTPDKPASAPATAPKADTKPPQDNTKPADPKTEEPKTKSNTTDNKTVPSVAPVPVKPAEKPTEKSTDGKTAATTPVTVKPTDAAKNVTVNPTEAPKDVTEKPPLAARGFDGSSFIGGIVLTLGLLAIGFMGLKYYKNKTERNYHTL